jgi:hypothetical protein
MDRYRVPSKQSGNIYEGLYPGCQEEARGFSTQALSVRRTYKSLNTSCKEGQVETLLSWQERGRWPLLWLSRRRDVFYTSCQE